MRLASTLFHRKSASRSALLCLVLVSFFLSSVAASADDLKTTDEIREAALLSYIHGMTPEIAREQIGTSGLATLRTLLADPTFSRPDNVVAFLAMLGTAEDVELLWVFLERIEDASLTPELDRAALLVPIALGELAARGHEEATDRLLDLYAASAISAPDFLQKDLAEMSLYGLARTRSEFAKRLLLQLQERSNSHRLLGNAVPGIAASALKEFEALVAEKQDSLEEDTQIRRQNIHCQDRQRHPQTCRRPYRSTSTNPMIQEMIAITLIFPSTGIQGGRAAFG